jgi:hypothetical protein
MTEPATNTNVNYNYITISDGLMPVRICRTKLKYCSTILVTLSALLFVLLIILLDGGSFSYYGRS